VPIPMSEVFDKWLEHSLALRRKQGLLKPSTAKSYTSMVKIHRRRALQRLRHGFYLQWKRPSDRHSVHKR